MSADLAHRVADAMTSMQLEVGQPVGSDKRGLALEAEVSAISLVRFLTR